MEWVNSKEEETKGKIYIFAFVMFSIYTIASSVATVYEFTTTRFILQLLFPNPIGFVCIILIAAFIECILGIGKNDKEETKDKQEIKDKEDCEKISVVGRIPSFIKETVLHILVFCSAVLIVVSWWLVHSMLLNEFVSDPDVDICICAVIAHSMLVAFEVTFVSSLCIWSACGLK